MGSDIEYTTFWILYAILVIIVVAVSSGKKNATVWNTKQLLINRKYSLTSNEKSEGTVKSDWQIDAPPLISMKATPQQETN